MNLLPLVAHLSAPAVALLARPLIRYFVLLAGLVIAMRGPVIVMRGIEGDVRVRAYAALTRAMTPPRNGLDGDQAERPGQGCNAPPVPAKS